MLIMNPLVMVPKLVLKYGPDVRIIVVAALFYAAACLGYFLAFDSSTLPSWPPSGVAFALILLLGRSAWPGIMIGSLLANLMAFWNIPDMPAQTLVIISFSIAAANTVEALVGNFLIKYWVKDDYPFRNAGNAFRFLFVTLFMCMVGAGIGATALKMTDMVTRFSSSALSWWIGNVVGILLFTPFILSFDYFRRLKFLPEKALEVGIFIIFALGLVFLLQFNSFNPTMERALPFLILPVLLWLAFRFELLIAMSAVLLVSLLSIYITIHQAGPFLLDQPDYSMFLLQIYIFVISVSTIVLSATVKERMEAQRTLLTFNETLESKVEERTRLLNDEIDTRRTAEEKLQRTNQELSKRNTELDNFVYSVSHDLRAPIASVLGLINLAKKDDGTMKDIYLEMINNSAKQQDHFIREILDQSRNSRLEIKREEIFFQPIIEETFNQLRFATATEQSVEKIVNIKQEKAFYCDRWRLKVILNNLISNAIRYRNGKDPVIKVNIEVDDDHNAKLEIEDNGKGIAHEHLANVCKMFYRATDDGAGSGLGLYIVKETIDKLNGSIKIDSEIGKGTMVRLSIPEVLN
jgi:signal transduction histidine kinase